MRPLAYPLLSNLSAAIYNASGFHVREDVAPLKLLFAPVAHAAGVRFHVREDVAPLKRAVFVGERRD